LKNILKDPEEFKKLTKHKLLEVIKLQINELKSLSVRTQQKRENFDSPSWAYLQAYEMGVQKTLNQLEEFITIK